jgi:hypothetical protein
MSEILGFKNFLQSFLESQFAMLLRVSRCKAVDIAKASKHAMKEESQWQGFEK